MSENKKIREYMDEIESILCSLEEATLGHFEIESPFVCYEPNTDKILALPLEHRSVKLFIERLAQEARSRYGTCSSFEKRGYKLGIEESKEELERLRAEVNELREAEKQWELQWKSEAAASAAGYNEAYDKFSDEIKTLKKENTKLREAAAGLREALDKIGHRNEPKDFNGDKTLGYLTCCEDVIKDANKALARFDAMKGDV